MRGWSPRVSHGVRGLSEYQQWAWAIWRNKFGARGGTLTGAKLGWS